MKYIAIFVLVEALLLVLTMITVRRPLYWVIQNVALALLLIGIPVIGILAYFRLWRNAGGGIGGPSRWQWRGGYLTWIWGNLEDGIVGPGMILTSWNAFYWSGLRNPVNNLRFVPGVSRVGRPLWRRTWGAKPGGWYAQAGWNDSGYPVLSGGRNVNPY
jgi:hypothetical protein